MSLAAAEAAARLADDLPEMSPQGSGTAIRDGGPAGGRSPSISQRRTDRGSAHGVARTRDTRPGWRGGADVVARRFEGSFHARLRHLRPAPRRAADDEPHPLTIDVRNLPGVAAHRVRASRRTGINPGIRPSATVSNSAAPTRLSSAESRSMELVRSGGRAVAGSNPVSPMTRKPRKRGASPWSRVPARAAAHEARREPTKGSAEWRLHDGAARAALGREGARAHDERPGRVRRDA